MNTLIEIWEKIAKLELEKAELLSDLEELREQAETQADALEEEIEQLQKEKNP